MCLQEICPNDKRSGVTELGMSHLQLGSLVANDRPVLGPVELERFARLESERHKRSTARRLQFDLQIGLPLASERRNAIVRTFIAKAHQFGMQFLQSPFLLAVLFGLRLQPR